MADLAEWAWIEIDDLQPWSRILKLSDLVDELDVVTPRWWVSQLDGIPFDESDRLIKMGWWLVEHRVDDEELPPWEQRNSAS